MQPLPASEEKKILQEAEEVNTDHMEIPAEKNVFSGNDVEVVEEKDTSLRAEGYVDEENEVEVEGEEEEEEKEERVLDVNAATRSGFTALHLAAQNGDTHVISSLLLLPHLLLDVKAKEKRGITPLMLAASRGSIDVCKLLLEGFPLTQILRMKS
jgi:ankyrin repeat protein